MTPDQVKDLFKELKKNHDLTVKVLPTKLWILPEYYQDALKLLKSQNG